MLALPRTHCTTLPPTHPPQPTWLNTTLSHVLQAANTNSVSTPTETERKRDRGTGTRREKKRQERKNTTQITTRGWVDTRYQSTTREKKEQTEQPWHHRGLNPRYHPVQGDSAECMPQAPFCTCTHVAYVIPCAVTHSIARSRRDRLKRRIKKVRFLRKQDRKRRTHKHLLSSHINESDLHS